MSYYFMAPGAWPSAVCIGSAQRAQGAMLQADTEIVHGFCAFVETQQELIEHLLDDKVILSNRQDSIRDISIIAKMVGGGGSRLTSHNFLLLVG